MHGAVQLIQTYKKSLKNSYLAIHLLVDESFSKVMILFFQ